MKITGLHFRGFWIVVLAAGGATALAAEQPASSATLAVVPPLSRAPSESTDCLRRLPPVDLPSGSFVSPCLSEAAVAAEGCWWVVNAPVSWETDCDAEPGEAGCETLTRPPGEPLRAEQLTDETLADENGELIQIAPDPPDPWCDDPFGRYAYHGSGDAGRTYWMPGSGDRMGMLGLVYDGFTPPKEGKMTFHPIVTWHLVSGPKRTDMPPRLWDFTARVGRRSRLGTCWSYEAVFRPGWFSDFEGSAREGLRFPGHGVLYYTPSDCCQLQLGIDYLDRDDIACLPVFGVAFKPHPDFRLDAVFPRPRVAYRVGGEQWLYLGAEMGGGTWAIERADSTNDVATYRDYRICLGWQGQTNNCTEVGFVFGRHLEYRSGTPSYDPLNTTILRSVLCY